jgi:hypothetical protein
MTTDARKSGADRTDAITIDDEPQGTLTVSDAIRFLWRGRLWVATAAAIGLLLGVTFVVLNAISKPSVTAYRTAITLTMLGAESRQEKLAKERDKTGIQEPVLTTYPNGAPFAPSDLRSPIVLQAAFERNNLTQYGMTFDRFAKSIDAEAYSPYVETITARYRARASARGITPQEIKTLEDDYRDELRAAQASGVLVTFTVDGEYGIPANVGHQVAQSIPAAWAEIFTKTLGVASAPIARSAAGVLDAKLAASLDYPLLFDYIETGASALDERLKAISELPNSGNLAVENSTMALSDLQRRADNVRELRVEKILRPLVDKGLSRDTELTQIIYQNKAGVLAVEESASERKSASISSVIRERTATDSPATQSQLSAQLTPSAQPGGGTSISAIGDSVMNRIVSLSIDNAGIEFREELLNQKLETEQVVAEKVRERRLIELRLAGLKALGDAALPAGVEKQAGVFDATATAAITELNEIWRLANEVLTLLSSDSLNDDKQLYTSMPLAEREENSPFYQSVYLWAVFGGLIVLSAIAGLIAYLLNSVVRQRSSLRQFATRG